MESGINDEMIRMREENEKLRAILTALVRDGWPWRADGTPNEIFMASQGNFALSMIDAKNALNG